MTGRGKIIDLPRIFLSQHIYYCENHQVISRGVFKIFCKLKKSIHITDICMLTNLSPFFLTKGEIPLHPIGVSTDWEAPVLEEVKGFHPRLGRANNFFTGDGHPAQGALGCGHQALLLGVYRAIGQPLTCLAGLPCCLRAPILTQN